jgi:hypothetical protein
LATCKIRNQGRETKVHDVGLLRPIQQNVRRLQVAMDKAGGMNEMHRLCDLFHDLQYLVDVDRSARPGLSEIAKGSAFQVLHYKAKALAVQQLVYRDQVVMAKPGGNASLSQVHVPPYGIIEQVLPQHFHCHMTSEFGVLGQVHRSKTPAAQLPLDYQVPGQGGQWFR